VSNYSPKVEILNARGETVRFVPGGFARSLVDAGALTPQPGAGRIRSAVIQSTPEMHAERLGPPTGRATGVRFTRWARLDESASRIVEHHPRATDYDA
jgi:hypothetical protein